MIRSCLPQPEPLKNLNELAKAQVRSLLSVFTQRVLNSVPCQLMFYATAAESLSSVQGEIEELSVAAEGEYRCVRKHLQRLSSSHGR